MCIRDSTHQERMVSLALSGNTDRVKLEELSAKSRQQIAVGSFSSILGAIGTFNKKAFKLAKFATIAESLVAIQGGIAKALNNPWPLNLAAAASVAAHGATIMGTLSSLNESSNGGSAGLSVGAGATAGTQVALPPPVQRPTNSEFGESVGVSDSAENNGTVNVFQISLPDDDESFMSTRRVRAMVGRMVEAGALRVEAVS